MLIRLLAGSRVRSGGDARLILGGKFFSHDHIPSQISLVVKVTNKRPLVLQ